VKVKFRIIIDKITSYAEIRFWYDNKLVGIQKIKNEGLNLINDFLHLSAKLCFFPAQDILFPKYPWSVP